MAISPPPSWNIIPRRVLINNTSCIMQCAPKLLLMFEQFYKYNFCGDIEYAAGHCVFSVATFRTAIKT